jgi:phospholipase/carboxylesterase
MATIDALKGPSLMPQSGKPAKSVVILLHGYGASGDDLIGLAPFFAHMLPDTAFYSPNAPQLLEGGFMGGYQWFGLGGYDPNAMARDPAVLSETFKRMRPAAENAAVTLNKYIDQVLSHHDIQSGQLALLGFSQGTMMSLHVGLRREKQLAAILGYSGALMGADRLAAEIKTKPPVALVHGDADPVVPLQAMKEIERTLTSVGVRHESLVIPNLQHGIDGEGAQFGANFLKKHLG